MTEAKTAEVVMKPKKFTKGDFLTEEPYVYLIDHYGGSDTVLQLATLEMAENAKEVGFTGFKDTLKIFLKAHQKAIHRGEIENHTEFINQPMELRCGDWECYSEILRVGIRGKEKACSHPIMPVERLRNLDTGEVKIQLAFSRSGRWQTTIVDAATLATTRTIVPALASQDISVTSSTAPALVDFLQEIGDLNRDVIPESRSIGRLGYIQGEGFSPYVDGLVFDGDASFRNLYNTVKSAGSQTEWYKTALECRKQSVTARILLAASFASPLLSIVGSLPFFVHLWGVDSGTGKTVALMLAASVWGNPALGSYLQTFNGTQVGQERTAAFLNHLPVCLDELQLTKDARGKTNFDVYQLAQGVGRSRGKKSGGVEMTPTWNCCFLTTGESPLTSISAGAGAINRVIDIECTAGSAVLTDGQRISASLKRNYGWAGQMFVEKIYQSEEVQEQIREIYQENFRDLCAGDSTEKQAMAAAAIVTADQLATMWIFKDDMELTVEDIGKFLASREAVSAGRRAYDWLCDWVAANANHFEKDSEAQTGETYGLMEGGKAYIIRSKFTEALQTQGYSDKGTLSYLRSNHLIETRGRSFTKPKKINKVPVECVVLRTSWDCELDFEEIQLLPD